MIFNKVKIVKRLLDRNAFSMQSGYNSSLALLKSEMERSYALAYSLYMYELNEIKFKNEDDCVLAEIEKSCEGYSDGQIKAVIRKAEKTLDYTGRHDFTAATRKLLKACEAKFDAVKAELENDCKAELLKLTVLYPKALHEGFDQSFSSK